MARIVILGCAGTGKTTLARQLGECTRAPVIYLDALWQSHCGGKDVSTFRALLKEAHAGDQWISDGNFAQATFDIRLSRATLVIWLECSKLSCAWRAIKRVFERGGDHKINALLDVWRSSGTSTGSTGHASRRFECLTGLKCRPQAERQP